MATMVNWFRDAWPCLLVVDVSVEVALLARLCSVPTVYVRQRGNRSDPPHALAYASATALLAPYPESFVDRPVLNEWMDKTVFTGFISRYAPYPSSDNPQSEFQAEYQAQSRPPLESKHVCVLVGYGGTVITATSLSEAARASPQWQWTVVGPVSRPSAETASPIPDNIRFLGVVNDPVRWLLSADVVIGSAGDSVVAEVAALRKRFICFAEPRPFDEQMATAQSLEHNGLAIYCRQWPGTILWPVLLGRALNLDPTRWDQFMQADGAAKAANAILSAAAQVYGTQSGRTTC